MLHVYAKKNCSLKVNIIIDIITILGSFRLDYEYEIEYEYDFRFQISDVSRALVLHVGFRQ